MEGMSRELFAACRRGETERVRRLVEEREVEVNVRDEWDCTPLYLACLCGHLELVRFLLQAGARCEANTFDGERCIYGALFPAIRKLLQSASVLSAAVVRREPYREFLRKLLESAEWADVEFVVEGRVFRAHRAVLSARSDFFAEKLSGRWAARPFVVLTSPKLTAAAFEALLSFLYTEQAEVDRDGVEDVERLARHCRLDRLLHLLQAKRKAANFFHKTKPGTQVRTMLVEPPLGSAHLNDDFEQLAEEAKPSELRLWPLGAEAPLLPSPALDFWPDVAFRLGDQTFHCHQAFFSSRSDYFRALISDPLGETERGAGEEGQGGVPVVPVRHMSTEVFVRLVSYVYTERAELDWDVVEEVMVAADLALLPGLKRLAGAWLGARLSRSSVLGALELGRAMGLPRLEDQAYGWLAEHLEEVVEEEGFADLVRQDAAAVAARQDVDSIDVVDNIRYHLTANSIDEAHDKLQLLDSLLDSLGLDA